MEKFMQRENVDVGYGKSTRNPSPDSEDMDFNDVFGGPPRRFSMQEVRARYSFGESEEETASSPWNEKPVFGEETTPRRRKGADFFDDIFKGGDHDRDRDRDRDRDSVFGSNPSSRIMSPKADPLATSLPASAQFSLPARLSKGVDLPTFGSHINHGEKRVDGGSNGFGSPLSRFSNEAARSMDDSNRNEVHPVARQSPLSNEASFMSEKDTNNDDSIGNQFHFSIYKWAGRGVPMLMPLVIENNLKSKDNMKYDKSVSSNERMERRSSSVRRKTSSAAREDVTSKEEQNHVHLSESKSKSSSNDSVCVKEEQVKSVDDSNVGEKIKKQVPVKIREGFKSEVKPLHAFLVDGEEPGETKDAHDSGRKGVDSNNANSRVTQRKSAASKGKVKEFVQIFNQEADVEGSRSSRRGNVGIDPKGINEVSSNPPKVKQEVNLDNVDKKPDVSSKVVENLKNDEAQQGFFPTRTSSHTTTRSSSTLRRSFSAGAQSHRDLKTSLENLDDPLEESFVVQELSDDHESVTQKESSEETKAIDAKIRQWSVGKKGNIRSLLSTLQYVLWPESGWKAVPLVDLIEANSVKRAYQKALLRLHPDKLQQKGAAFHHKYIAEKVFDILQEAWDHFNTCSSLGI